MNENEKEKETVNASGEEPKNNEDTVKTEEKNGEKTEEPKTEKEDKKGKEQSKKELQKAIKVLEKQLEEMQACLEAQNQKYLTMLAEYDNFRKRAAKEKEATYSLALCDTVNQILPVLDNMERAVAYASSSNGDTVAEGIEKIMKQFEESFSKLGIKEIEAVGKPFDPNFHNAVMHEDNPDIEGESIITDVFQKGYMYSDKVIRHSVVKVVN